MKSTKLSYQFLHIQDFKLSFGWINTQIKMSVASKRNRSLAIFLVGVLKRFFYCGGSNSIFGMAASCQSFAEMCAIGKLGHKYALYPGGIPRSEPPSCDAP